jgi:hypothetical protein
MTDEEIQAAAAQMAALSRSDDTAAVDKWWAEVMEPASPADSTKIYLASKRILGEPNCIVIRPDGGIATPDDPMFKRRTAQ